MCIITTGGDVADPAPAAVSSTKDAEEEAAGVARIAACEAVFDISNDGLELAHAGGR